MSHPLDLLDSVVRRSGRFPMANDTDGWIQQSLFELSEPGLTEPGLTGSERNPMQPPDLDRFLNFTFEKDADDIISHCQSKIVAIRAKIKERKARIARIREEYAISDAALNELYEQAHAALRQGAERLVYNTKTEPVGAAGEVRDITIGAGTVNNLFTESDFIQAEEKQIAKLELISRNLKNLPDQHGVVRGHRLTNQELTFLGF